MIYDIGPVVSARPYGTHLDTANWRDIPYDPSRPTTSVLSVQSALARRKSPPAAPPVSRKCSIWRSYPIASAGTFRILRPSVRCRMKASGIGELARSAVNGIQKCIVRRLSRRSDPAEVPGRLG